MRSFSFTVFAVFILVNICSCLSISFFVCYFFSMSLCIFFIVWICCSFCRCFMDSLSLSYYQKGQNFFNNPCPLLQWLNGKQQQQESCTNPQYLQFHNTNLWSDKIFRYICVYYSPFDLRENLKGNSFQSINPGWKNLSSKKVHSSNTNI